MNLFTPSIAVSSLTIAMLTGTAGPASAQAYFPPTLSPARRACLPAPAPRYVPGHYETVREQVRVPGAVYRAWVPARYQTYCGLFGRRYQRLLSPGHYETRRAPDRYEQRSRQVWVPGHYSY